MSRVFADTGYWIAIVSARDELHSRAVAVSRALASVQLVTSEWVLTELLNHFAERDERIRFRVTDFVAELIANPAVLVVPFAALSFDEAFRLYRARWDKQWSLSDCSSFVIMDRYGIAEALTYDRHFDQAGFRALLRE